MLASRNWPSGAAYVAAQTFWSPRPNGKPSRSPGMGPRPWVPIAARLRNRAGIETWWIWPATPATPLERDGNWLSGEVGASSACQHRCEGDQEQDCPEDPGNYDYAQVVSAGEHGRLLCGSPSRSRSRRGFQHDDPRCLDRSGQVFVNCETRPRELETCRRRARLYTPVYGQSQPDPPARR